MVTEPLFPPHPALTTTELAVIAVGELSVTVCAVLHPPASFTVIVYVPAARLFAVAAVPPDGVQL
jgi:hypothetical protein